MNATQRLSRRLNVAAVANGNPQTAKIGPVTRKLSGIVKLPPGKVYKELLDETLRERYQT